MSGMPATEIGQSIAPPEVGREIQRWRKEARLSLDELARRSGVSKSILSQIERDRANPTLSTIWRICAALDREPGSLFGTPDAPPAGIDRLPVNATPEIHSEDGLCRLRILGAVDTVETVQWYEFEAEPKGELSSSAHGEGSVEHLTVFEGKLTVEANGARQSAGPGESLRYPTAQGLHRIVNEGGRRARAFMVCTLRP